MNKQRVLILCTGNSARSQIAEAILRHVSEFEVHSAGVAPTAVKPEVKEVLDEINIRSDGLWSKSVDEFAGQEFDYIITVCDNANQNCPIFPGKAKRIHWSIHDPVDVKGEQGLNAFRNARDELMDKLLSFTNGR
jgi:arsenate reductase